MKHVNNLTQKGQVTVPKDIRDALGLIAGRPVRFEMDDHGNARIMKADGPDALEKRADKIRQRLAEIRALNRPLYDFDGMDGLAYQQWIRGNGPEV